MDEFNYLSVFISIILGLGLTQLLAGFARWLEQRGAFTAYAPSLCWAGVLLLMHVQTWWTLFELRRHADWTFAQFFLLLLQPVTLYLLATLALPGTSAPAVDLRTNYHAHRRWFFSLLIFLLVVSLLKDVVLTGSLPRPANLAFHALFGAMALAAVLTDRERYHQAFGVMASLGFVAYVAALFTRLQ